MRDPSAFFLSATGGQDFFEESVCDHVIVLKLLQKCKLIHYSGVMHMKKILSQFRFNNEGKITFAVLVILLIGSFYLGRGYFKLRYSPVGN